MNKKQYTKLEKIDNEIKEVASYEYPDKHEQIYDTIDLLIQKAKIYGSCKEYRLMKHYLKKALILHEKDYKPSMGNIWVYSLTGFMASGDKPNPDPTKPDIPNYIKITPRLIKEKLPLLCKIVEFYIMEG